MGFKMKGFTPYTSNGDEGLTNDQWAKKMHEKGITLGRDLDEEAERRKEETGSYGGELGQTMDTTSTTNTQTPTDDDPGSGRKKADELRNDIIELNKSMRRHSNDPVIVAKLRKAKKEIQAELLKIAGTPEPGE
jgi:hypothetical protein